MTFDIPKIKVRADYESSGVLILVQASGSGQYWGEYGKSAVLLLFNNYILLISGARLALYFL